MTDAEVLKAVCCLAGADSDVTVDEIQALAGLARQIGLDTAAFNELIAEMRDDEEFRERQLDIAERDPNATVGIMIDAARRVEAVDDGNTVMLLWRVAAKLGIESDHFEALLAAGRAT
jgi:hypothetical protein